jgi:hypothetical protein
LRAGYAIPAARPASGTVSAAGVAPGRGRMKPGSCSLMACETRIERTWEVSFESGALCGTRPVQSREAGARSERPGAGVPVKGLLSDRVHLARRHATSRAHTTMSHGLPGSGGVPRKATGSRCPERRVPLVASRGRTPRRRGNLAAPSPNHPGRRAAPTAGAGRLPGVRSTRTREESGDRGANLTALWPENGKKPSRAGWVGNRLETGHRDGRAPARPEGHLVPRKDAIGVGTGYNSSLFGWIIESGSRWGCARATEPPLSPPSQGGERKPARPSRFPPLRRGGKGG